MRLHKKQLTLYLKREEDFLKNNLLKKLTFVLSEKELMQREIEKLRTLLSEMKEEKEKVSLEL
jgi:hypothetical protein